MLEMHYKASLDVDMEEDQEECSYWNMLWPTMV